MKTAIYIEEGTTQIVLTPDSDFEKDIIRRFAGKTANVQVMIGSFYDCRGGWIRQKDFLSGEKEERSLIFRVDDTPKESS